MWWRYFELSWDYNWHHCNRDTLRYLKIRSDIIVVGILWTISRLDLTSLWWRYFVLEMNYKRNVRKVPLRTFVLPVNICWYINMFYFIIFNSAYPYFMLRFWSGISCINVCIVCICLMFEVLIVCLLLCYSVCVGSNFVS